MDWAEERSSYSSPFVYVYSNLLLFFNSFTLKQGAYCFLFPPLTIQSEMALPKARSRAGRMQDAAGLTKLASSCGHEFTCVPCSAPVSSWARSAIPEALQQLLVTPQGDGRVYRYRRGHRWIKGLCTRDRTGSERGQEEPCGVSPCPRRGQELFPWPFPSREIAAVLQHRCFCLPHQFLIRISLTAA